MSTLNDRVARLRRTRVSLYAARKAAYADPDPGYRQQKIQAAELALKSTDEAWDRLMAEQEARIDRVNLAQLRHELTHPSVAPVRRTVPVSGYVTKIMVPGR